MTIQTIEAAYQQLWQSPLPQHVFQFDWSFLLLLFTCMFIFLLFCFMSGFSAKGAVILATFLGLLLATVGTSFVSRAESDDALDAEQLRYVIQQQQQIEKWKQEQVVPYFSTLPEEKRLLSAVQMDQAAVFSESTSDQARMIIAYPEGEQLITRKVIATNRIDLPAGSAPYVTFVTLQQPIGRMDQQTKEQLAEFWGSNEKVREYFAFPDEQFPKGVYHYTIHLPAGYTFATIKP